MKDKDLRICFVGDSYVNGTSDPEYLGWTGRIAIAARRKGYPLTYYNLGLLRMRTWNKTREPATCLRCLLKSHEARGRRS